MKKINSINYAGKIIGAGLIIMFVIPGILMLINIILNYAIILFISRLLFLIGAFTLVCFAVHLFVELHQDKKIDEYYSKHKNIKIKINNGKYECGACGSRGIGLNDNICNICGCIFEQLEDKQPEEILNSSEK